MSYAAARFLWLRTASSSCSSREIPHSLAMIAACSPIDSPVRGSALRGICGTICCGRSLASAFSRDALLLDRLIWSSTWRRSSLTAIGASEVVSNAAGDAGVDLPERDLVRDEDRGLEPGAAGLLEVVRGRVRIQARAEHGLARQIEIAAVLEHAAGGDLAEDLVLDRELADQRCPAWRSACPGSRPSRRGRSAARTGFGCRRALPPGGYLRSWVFAPWSFLSYTAVA